MIVTPEGRIAVAAGATSLGQGLPTTLAQVCAEVLQVPLAHIAVHLGDTRWMPTGVGSSASRSAVMAGSAVHHASTRLREQIVAIAAARFEASPADIELADGATFVRGVPDRRCSLRERSPRSPRAPSNPSGDTKPRARSALSACTCPSWVST